MEEANTLLIPYSRATKVFVVLRFFIVIPLLLFSLIIYLIGLALTLTIVGAFIGIPIILSTYAIDIILISYLINPLASLKSVNCPNCKNGKLIITDVMKIFICGGCDVEVSIKKSPAGEG